MTESNDSGRPPAVLVLADEAVTGHFIAHELTTAGLAPQVVAGMAAAKDAIDRGGFDLVVAGALSLDVELGAALAAAGRPLVLVEVPGAAPPALPQGLPVIRLTPPLDGPSIRAAARLAVSGMAGSAEVAEVARHLERFRERREFLDKLASSFLAECPGRRQTLAQAVGSGSCPLAASEAHGLVSTAVAMGSGHLAELARTVETAARENRGQDLTLLLPELDAALERVETYVRSVLPGGKGQSWPSESSS